MDGGGIDVWKGTRRILRLILLFVLLIIEKDSEIKLLLGCNNDEKDIIYRFHNESEYMKGILIDRKD